MCFLSIPYAPFCLGNLFHTVCGVGKQHTKGHTIVIVGAFLAGNPIVFTASIAQNAPLALKALGGLFPAPFQKAEKGFALPHFQ